ncbi:MAG: hypothetical protein L6Q76_21835 [Polyangiaceae bacterium]|nr:hypothetical protein [Polyangiaceae bacterium]
MRDFAASAGRLRVLSFGAKLLYTAFAISAIIGLLISWRLYGAAVGEGGDKVYYSGAPAIAAPATPAPAPAADGDGPALELPEEATAPRVMTEQISDRKLLEVTHFHVFSVPVYVLILAHLWLLARMPSWLHTAGIAASVVTSGIHMAAPWIIRGRPGLSALMPISGIAMLVVMGIISIVPAIDMWLPRPARRPTDDGGRDTPDT